jgi:hypothetical protein
LRFQKQTKSGQNAVLCSAVHIAHCFLDFFVFQARELKFSVQD